MRPRCSRCRAARPSTKLSSRAAGLAAPSLPGGLRCAPPPPTAADAARPSSVSARSAERRAVASICLRCACSARTSPARSSRRRPLLPCGSLARVSATRARECGSSAGLKVHCAICAGARRARIAHGTRRAKAWKDGRAVRAAHASGAAGWGSTRAITNAKGRARACAAAVTFCASEIHSARSAWLTRASRYSIS